MSFIHLAARNFARPRIALAIHGLQILFHGEQVFSAAAGLTKEAIETRVLDVLKGFEKVNRQRCSLNCNSLNWNLFHSFLYS